jgi:hypothetical protein
MPYLGPAPADSIVDTAGITDDAVTAAKIAANAVDSSEIAAGSVDIAHLSASGTAGSGNFLRGDNSWQTAGLTGVTTGSGNVTITSGNLIVASGNGIDFSATADGTTMSSELLDDYEEGSWTPAIVGGTQVISSIGRATYTKIGRMVTLHVYVSQSTETDATVLTWSGVPFTSAGYGNSGLVEFYGNTSGSPILCRVGEAATVIYFYKVDIATSAAITQTQNTTHTIFTLTYEAT